MRKGMSEFPDEGAQTSSKHSWEIISEEQQWRPCLCSAPTGFLSFIRGFSFHLEQLSQRAAGK